MRLKDIGIRLRDEKQVLRNGILLLSFGALLVLLLMKFDQVWGAVTTVAATVAPGHSAAIWRMPAIIRSRTAAKVSAPSTCHRSGRLLKSMSICRSIRSISAQLFCSQTPRHTSRSRGRGRKGSPLLL